MFLRFTPVLALALLYLSFAVSAHAADGYRLVKIANDPRVYVAVGSNRIHIPSESVFLGSGFQWKELKTISNKEMNAIHETNLIKSKNSPDVYVVVADQDKMKIPDEQSFHSAGFSWTDIIDIDQAQVDWYVKKEYDASVARKVLPTLLTTPEPLVVPVKETPPDQQELDTGEARVQIELRAPLRKRLGDVSNFLPQYGHVRITDVNKRGDIVGCVSKNIATPNQAFYFSKRKLTLIPRFSSRDYTSESCANGVNDMGYVVGEYSYKEGKTQAFMWYKGKATSLGFFSDGDNSTARAINNKGQIAGTVSIPRPDGITYGRAVLWNNGVIQPLEYYTNASEYSTSAEDINDEGQVLVDSNGVEPYIWQNHYAVKMSLLAPSLLPANVSIDTDIPKDISPFVEKVSPVYDAPSESVRPTPTQISL